MARHDADEFEGEDCVRVYIAGRLPESLRVERTLDDHGIDYFVEVELFQKLLLGVIPRDYHGAAFHVRAADAETARRALLQVSLRAGLQNDGTPPAGATDR